MLTSMTWWMEYNKLPWFSLLPLADLRSLTYWGHNNTTSGSPVNHHKGNDPQLAQGSCSAKSRWETLGLMTHRFHTSLLLVFEHTFWQPQNVQDWQGVGAMLEQRVHRGSMMPNEDRKRASNFFRLPKNKGPRMSNSSLSYFSRCCFSKSWRVITLDRF